MSLGKMGKPSSGIKVGLLEVTLLHLHLREEGVPRSSPAPKLGRKQDSSTLQSTPEAHSGPKGPRQAARPEDLPTGLCKGGQPTTKLSQGCSLVAAQESEAERATDRSGWDKA